MTISTAKKLVGVTAAAGLVFGLAGCGQAPEKGEGGAQASSFTPCIVSDSGGFDDRSFNQLSYEGAQAAAKELDTKLKQAESNSDTDFAPNLESMVGEGCNTIVSVGFALSAATVESAKANPDVDYIIVDDAADNDFDGKTDADNIKPLLYDTAQGAFLAGYLSAGYSKAGKVGTFGGMEFPTVTIFMDGFKQGVDYYNKTKGKDVQVVGWNGETGSFTGGFEANQDAKTTAQNIIDQGVDVLLPVGGPVYQSALQAIKESNRDIALIGVDADLYETDPNTQDYVLTSILKKMDVSTKEAVVASSHGKFDASTYVGTLENEGVDIASFHNFESKVDKGLADEVQALKKDIIDGKVTVKSYLG